MTTQKKLLLITTGGTIACALDESGGVVPTYTGEQLLARISDIEEIADISVASFRQLPSSDIRLTDVIDLLQFIESKQDFDGYIITHGTDTIEETAFALDLLYQGDKPVIITGAMRHQSLPGADGDANIWASAIVASDMQASGQGVLVVFNDRVHAARFVRKAHTANTDAFVSQGAAPVGMVSEGSYLINQKIAHRETIESTLIQSDFFEQYSEVPIIKLASGDDGSLLALAIDSGRYKGLVIEAFGAGHAGHAIAQQVERANGDPLIIVATRTGVGATFTQTYGAIGSEIDLIRKKAIMAGLLDAAKARIYLQLLLASGHSREAIKRRFTDYRVY